MNDITAEYYNEDLLGLQINEFMSCNQLISIGLMHVDLAKDWKHIAVILGPWAPYLDEGSKVIFQDIYYHWSFGISTAGSSLCCTIKKRIDVQILTEISDEMLESSTDDNTWNYITGSMESQIKALSTSLDLSV